MKGLPLAAISISVRHGTAPGDLQDFAVEKCARLEKFLRAEPRVEFHLEQGKTVWTGEVILHGSRHNERFVAHDEHADAHGCVEILVEKLWRQLEKGKEKRKDHRGPSMAGDGKPPRGPDPADEP